VSQRRSVKRKILEGIFSGMSSGAAMHVAVEMSKKYSKQIIVVLLPDGGEKYISTELFNTLAPSLKGD
jgi:cysteine synthase